MDWKGTEQVHRRKIHRRSLKTSKPHLTLEDSELEMC